MQSKFCDPMMCHAVFELAYEALWGEVDHIRHCKFMFQKYERERESYESCVDKKREEINERKKLIFDGLFGE
ncbi:MAG: hypothetical protein Q4A15_11315 [Prevotellaceae bacterium]|nr:hypothetical protein [Prevotellaceae bacterium]